MIVGDADGDVIGLDVVGDADDDADGDTDGDVVGADVVDVDVIDDIDGDVVGSDIVGDTDGDIVGLDVVGDVDNENNYGTMSLFKSPSAALLLEREKAKALASFGGGASVS